MIISSDTPAPEKMSWKVWGAAPGRIFGWLYFHENVQNTKYDLLLYKKKLTSNLFIVSKDIDSVHYSVVNWRVVSILNIFLLKCNKIWINKKTWKIFEIDLNFSFRDKYWRYTYLPVWNHCDIDFHVELIKALLKTVNDVLFAGHVSKFFDKPHERSISVLNTLVFDADCNFRRVRELSINYYEIHS